ncbi:hypothetical protein BDW22DRAFT_1357678 [Trametopsis cervina]|nr:hypothetical protein BDW22DRAFT_1357678 [Trametopsis cervina]
MASKAVAALTSCGLTETSAKALLAKYPDEKKATEHPIEYIDAAWAADNTNQTDVYTAVEARAALVKLGLKETLVNSIVKNDAAVAKGPVRAPTALGLMVCQGERFRAK